MVDSFWLLIKAHELDERTVVILLSWMLPVIFMVVVTVTLRSHGKTLRAHGEILSELTKTLNEVKMQVNVLATQVNVLTQQVNVLMSDMHNIKAIILPGYLTASALKQANSPIGLTELGNKVSMAIDANQIVEDNLDKFKEMVKADSIKSAYDMQQACLSMSFNLDGSDVLTEKQIAKVKYQSYLNGTPLYDTFSIIGILLTEALVREYRLNEPDELQVEANISDKKEQHNFQPHRG